MNKEINIYCDESCHLQYDESNVMILGAIWVPRNHVREINVAIRKMKEANGLASDFEIKWTKVSPAKLKFYKEVINYFFSNDHLHFRAIIIPDKRKLQHEKFGQTHDDWYYKMYFDMLKIIFDPTNKYKIYLDIKDTRSAIKIKKLHDVLCNNFYDFSREIIEHVQTVRSHEIEILQMTDLFIGAVGYVNRDLQTSSAKLELIELIRSKSGYKLTESTLFKENKLNIFKWYAQEVG